MTTNQEARDLFLAQQNSQHTRSTYERGLSVFAAFTQDKPFADVTDTDLMAFKASLSDMASASQFIRWTAVRSMFGWLVLSGRIKATPFVSVKGPQKTKNVSPKVPSNDRFMAVALMSDTDCKEARDWRDRAILRLLGTGLRVGEIVGIGVEDFYEVPEYDAWVVRVIGKGNKERIVPVTNLTARAIEDWKGLRGCDRFHLFLDQWGEPMTVRQVQSAIERRCDRIRVPRLNAHSLRHHYATRLIRAGADPFTVQKLMGHASIQTTQLYVGLDMTDTVRASRLDPI
jgi:site-specific recombinase XerC